MLCINHVALPLSNVINNSFAAGSFTQDFKHAKVCPVFKNGDRFEFSIIIVLYLFYAVFLVFEKLMYNRLINYFNKHSIISSNQFGF